MRYLISLFFIFGLLRAEYIEEYNVTVTLESSGVFHVVEDILYDFYDATKERHGIYRNIPTHVEVNGTFINIGIKDIEVMQDEGLANVEISRPYRSLFIRIGSADIPIYGKHHYRISYRVDEGILPSRFTVGKDMLFWNAIGDQWNVPIAYVKVIFNLPKELDREHITVLYPDAKRYHWENDHQLKARIESLKPEHGFAVAIEFDRGLLEQSGEAQYTKASATKRATEQRAVASQYREEMALRQAVENQQHYAIVMWVAFLLFVLLWYVSRDLFHDTQTQKSIVVQYYPPEGISLLQAGLLYDKYTDNEDFSAAVLELAHLKHLVIIEEGKRTFLLKRERSVDALSEDQRMMLEALFEGGERYELKQQEHSHAKSMREHLDKIKQRLYRWAVEGGYSIEDLGKLRSMLFFGIIVVVLLLALLAFLFLFMQYTNDNDAKGIAAGTLLALAPALLIASRRFTLSTKIFVAVIGLAMVGVLIALEIFNTSKRVGAMDLLMNPAFFFGMVVILLMDGYQRLGHLTAKGRAVRDHLYGLEEFSKRVKKEEIERLLKEDRHYLERMLPYAMLFGQVEHWLGFYALLDLPNPRLSNGSVKVIGSLSSSFSQATYTSSSSSSGGYRSSGSGGFSGGGFSGGGGGGGGGSW